MERAVNLARSERVVICLLRLARPNHLQIVTGGVDHERVSRHAVAHLVCRSMTFSPLGFVAHFETTQRRRPPHPLLSSPAGNLNSCHALGVHPQPPHLLLLLKWLRAIPLTGLAPSVLLSSYIPHRLPFLPADGNLDQ